MHHDLLDFHPPPLEDSNTNSPSKASARCKKTAIKHDLLDFHPPALEEPELLFATCTVQGARCKVDTMHHDQIDFQHQFIFKSKRKLCKKTATNHDLPDFHPTFKSWSLLFNALSQKVAQLTFFFNALKVLIKALEDVEQTVEFPVFLRETVGRW